VREIVGVALLDGGEKVTTKAGEKASAKAGAKSSEKLLAGHPDEEKV